MDVEIGVTRRQKCVVLRRLDVGSLRIEHLPGRQRAEDRIGQIDGLIEASVSVEVMQVLIEWSARSRDPESGIVDAAIEVGAETIMAVVHGTEVELWNPEKLGPLKLRLGNPGAGLCGGNDQWSGIGQ